MAIMSSSRYIEIFKFEQSGLTALCQEVAAYLAMGNHRDNALRDAVLSSAEYERRDGMHIIRYRRKRDD